MDHWTIEKKKLRLSSQGCLRRMEMIGESSLSQLSHKIRCAIIFARRGAAEYQTVSVSSIGNEDIRNSSL